MTMKNSRLADLSDRAVYLLVRLVVAVLGIFPYESCQGVVRFLAFLFTDVFPVRRSVLNENLSIAFPDADPSERRCLIFAMWRHLLLMGIEFFIGRRVLHETNWRRYVRIVDGRNKVRLFFSNRPLILVTGHFGNFEMGGHVLGLLGYPTFSVARSLDNRYLNRYVGAMRESTGQYLLEKNGGYEDILDVLENRGIVAFLADQSAGPRGCWVDFFGRAASAYKAMALMSLQYSAPILVCHCTRIKGEAMRFELAPVDYFDPLDPPEGIESVFEITQWFTSVLEKNVRRQPEQYWWLHRRWKTFGRAVSLESIRRKIRTPHATASAAESAHAAADAIAAAGPHAADRSVD